ncbi:DNA mismatch repair protein MutT, partial [Rhizobium brockwellii]
MTPRKKSRKPRPDKSQPLLRQLAAVPETLFAGAFLQQYGAICFRHGKAGSEVEILVITSRERGRWV